MLETYDSNVFAEPEEPSVCHCRMCQKAMGNVFAPLAGVHRDDFAWTRGAPAVFLSSPVAERGFCARCGTPLTFRYLDTERISVTIGSLDRPDAAPPVVQNGVEARVGWLDRLGALPGVTTEDDQPAGRFAKIVSYQHPDHDTPEGWRPPGAGAPG